MTPRKKLKVSEDGAAVATAPELEDGYDPDRGINLKHKSKHNRELFVHSLPASATNESLAEFFSQSAPLKHAVAVNDKDGRCKGFGFVTFAEAEDAQKAIEEFNGQTFEGKKIKVEVAASRHREVVSNGLDGQRKSQPAAEAVRAKEERSQKLQGGKEQQQSQAPPRLIIRNLPWSIKKPEDLSKLFLSYGKVKEVKLPQGKNGTLKGFGFILLRGRKNAEKAMEGINGKDVDGRTLAVDWAAPKDVWEKQQGTEHSPPANATDDEPVSEDEEDEEDGIDLGVVGEGDDASDSEEDEDEEDEEGGVDLDEDEARDNDDPTVNGRTIFVRNLPFTVDENALYQHFRSFGPLKGAQVVRKYSTGDEEGRHGGTGFVHFHRAEDVQSCLKEAPRTQPTSANQAKDKSFVKHSLLEDTQADPTGRYTIEGRVLNLSIAVDRNEAQRLAAEGTAKRNREDKRRLYLLREGTISSNSPLSKQLTDAEARQRDYSAKQRQDLIKKNPALHLSFTRLAIRNIPRFVTPKELKALARQAVVGFAEEVKAGKRQPLSKEEISRGGDAMKEAERDRKRKGVGVVKQAKIIFESREGSKVSEGSGAGRSRGYGFVEYSTHRWALMGLRWLNGHSVKRSSPPDKTAAAGEADTPKRLIVEFAIENAQVVQRRRDREQKSRDPASFNRFKKDTASGGDDKRSSRSRDNKRKRSSAEAGPDPKDSEADTKESKGALREKIIARKRAKRRARKGN